MINILRELIEKEKQIVELSNELSETKNLLNFSLDDSEEKEKEIKGLKEHYINKLKEIEKKLNENDYNHKEFKIRQVKEMVKNQIKELEV